MFELNYKTRNYLSPQGKPRVYFCSHPDDFNMYFNAITDEILDLQNCAIYYNNDYLNNYDIEDIHEKLSQMQLFVIPITAKFLNDENRARCVEFNYALKCHIPILPLMQEDNIDELFNLKCANLQFINKTDSGVLKVKYQEKLKKYLNSILIGEDLSKRIHSAFDLCFFLSYNKKDIKYAKEVMKLIHKNKSFLSIAIWFDEYLVPGENFETSISDSILESDSFILLVTPNILEKENYIMTTEYPIALKENKPIIPIECVKTDKTEISRCYKDIPSCIELEQENQIYSIIYKIIKNLKIELNEYSPEKNFLIGLAYLNGIDVEVNFEKALELITLSAEKDYIDAIEKLAIMYRLGEGVKIDYDKSIYWLEYLKDVLLKDYFKIEPEKNLLKILDVYNSLYTMYFEFGEFYKMEECYIETKKLLSVTDIEDSFEVKILNDLGYAVICLIKNNIEEGIDVCKNIIIDIEKGKQDFNDFVYSDILALTYGFLNEFFQKIGKNNICDTEISILKNANSYKDCNRNLYVSYISACANYKEKGDLEKAEDMCLLAIKIAKKNDLEKRTIQSKNDLILAYNSLSSLYIISKRYIEALDYCNKALRLCTDTMPTTDISIRRSYCLSFSILAKISLYNHCFERFVQATLKAVEICNALMIETHSYSDYEMILELYSNLMDYYSIIGDDEKALYYTQKLEMIQAVINEL